MCVVIPPSQHNSQISALIDAWNNHDLEALAGFTIDGRGEQFTTQATNLLLDAWTPEALARQERLDMRARREGHPDFATFIDSNPDPVEYVRVTK